MDRDLGILLDTAKRHFISRHMDRCGYLRVDVADRGEVVHLLVRFTLDKARTWHRAEAEISLESLAETGLGARVAAAFSMLDDGIETARLAHLFKPMTAAQRMGTGRRG